MTEPDYAIVKPDEALADVVESFWMLTSRSEKALDVIVLPDGRIDIFFSKSSSEPYHVTLLGLGSRPEKSSILPGTTIFAVSFRLPAVEYILKHPVAAWLNSACHLPAGFWGLDVHDLEDFNGFCIKVSAIIRSLRTSAVDERKRILFELIYTTHGDITVKAASAQSFWSSRQINRYFREQFGLSLKAYCNILRFRAAFPRIKAGNFFPEAQFADQAHFIKDVKRFSGVTPKELSKNKNDRFIQFTAVPKQ